jgi:Amt family ammonium transporter
VGRGRLLAGLWSGNGFIGGFEHAFLRGVGLAPNPNYGGTIPEQSFMIYQLMFAIITPALITGAFAERVKFSSMAVFLVSGRWWSTAPWRT